MKTQGKPELVPSTSGAIMAAPRNAQSLKAFLESKEVQAKIASVLPRSMSAERLVRVLLSGMQSTPKLAECTQQSIVLGIMHCAALGLEPNSPLQHAWLVPFGTVAQAVIGYKGLVKLAMQSDHVSSVEARVVHARDVFECEFGLTPQLVHRPWLGGGDPGKVVAAYAIIRLRGDMQTIAAVMTTEEIEAIRKCSRAGTSGPWVNHWEAMASKTVLRRALKFAPMDMAAEEAVISDEAREFGDAIETTSVEPQVIVETTATTAPPQTQADQSLPPTADSDGAK
jgi:recombination protein RecT